MEDLWLTDSMYVNGLGIERENGCMALGQRKGEVGRGYLQKESL